MRCPRCGFEQPPGEECVRCGVVFRKLEAVETSPDVEVGPIAGFEAEELDEVERRERRELKEVTLFTGQFKIQGKVSLIARGYRGRFSDMLNDSALQFIPVLEAKAMTVEGEIKVPFAPVMLVNKSEIHFVIPP